MASTKIKISSRAQVFHTVAASGDMAAHDVGTTDSVAVNMGGSTNFVLDDSSSTVTHTSISKVADATSEGVAIGSAAITKYIYIKNTGYQEAAKTTTTTSDLTIGIGGNFADGGFTLSSGEAITLHGLGGGSNNLSEIKLDSSSGNIYVEIIYL